MTAVALRAVEWTHVHSGRFFFYCAVILVAVTILGF